MKKLLLITILALVTLSVFSQKWEQFYGEPNRYDFAESITEYYDNGNYIIAGYEGDGWIIKTDINGEELYNTVFTHDLYDFRFTSAACDNAGNLYICGFIVMDGSWPMVIKINTCGEEVWCKTFMDLEYNDGWAKDIIINSNGDIIVLVKLNSNSQVNQLFLYGLNDLGTLLWINTYASANTYPEIAVASVSNLYQFGKNYIIDGYCYWPYPGNPGQVFQRPLFIKIDSLFNEEWILPYGVSDSIVGKAWHTIQISDKLYMGACMLRLEDPVEHSLIVYFNENGEELIHYEIPNDSIGPDVSQNYIVDIVQMNDSLFLASIPVGYNDTWYEYGDFVIDSTGRIYNFVMRENTKGYSNIIKTSDNNYVVAVEIEESKSDRDILLYKIDENLEQVPLDTNTYVYDSLCPGSIQSGAIDITNCIIWTDVEETPSPQEYYTSLKTVHIKAYPNPVKDGGLTFEFQNTSLFSEMELKCFNVFGREVYSEKVYQSQGETQMDVSNWNNGMYIGVISNNGQVLGNCKFIVK